MLLSLLGLSLINNSCHYLGWTKAYLYNIVLAFKFFKQCITSIRRHCNCSTRQRHNFWKSAAGTKHKNPNTRYLVQFVSLIIYMWHCIKSDYKCTEFIRMFTIMKWNCNASLRNLLYNKSFYNTLLSWLIRQIEYSMLASTHHTLAGRHTHGILTGGWYSCFQGETITIMKWNCNASLCNLLYNKSFYNTLLSWLIRQIEYSMLASTHHTLAGRHTHGILTGGMIFVFPKRNLSLA